MTLSIFSNKMIQPTEEGIRQNYDDNRYQLWLLIRQSVSKNYPSISEEWIFYSIKTGWSLVIKSRQRTLLYLFPTERDIKVNLALGSKTTEKILQSSLSEEIKNVIRETTNYVAGRPSLFDVLDLNDVEHMVTLLKIKTSK